MMMTVCPTWYGSSLDIERVRGVRPVIRDRQMTGKMIDGKKRRKRGRFGFVLSRILR